MMRNQNINEMKKSFSNKQYVNVSLSRKGKKYKKKRAKDRIKLLVK